jgi:hypothetical protein
MVTENVHERKPLFLCNICGFGYEDYDTVEACEGYCKTFNNCIIKIMEKAIYVPMESKIKETE